MASANLTSSGPTALLRPTLHWLSKHSQIDTIRTPDPVEGRLQAEYQSRFQFRVGPDDEEGFTLHLLPGMCVVDILPALGEEPFLFNVFDMPGNIELIMDRYASNLIRTMIDCTRERPAQTQWYSNLSSPVGWYRAGEVPTKFADVTVVRILGDEE